MRPAWLLCAALLLSPAVRACAAPRPPDVPSGHWASAAVSEALANHAMALESDGRFHGEARVTHSDASIAMARLARLLLSRNWRRAASKPIRQSVMPLLSSGKWKQRPVTRYMLASVISRFGDYVSNGIPPAPAGAKDLRKSELIPPPAAIPAGSPDGSALRFLVSHNMLWAGSPLATKPGAPLIGAELSRAMSELVVGYTNEVTPLGLDANGNTPDASFHTKPRSKK